MSRSSAVMADDGDKSHVLSRMAAILGAISREGVDGIRLVDLARVTGIARPSVHRMLQDLIAIDYVEQHTDKLYSIGPALFTLGLAAPNPIVDPILLRRLARELAERSGDTIYVAIRHVDGVHYLMREEGRYPIRTHYIAVGDVRAYTSTFCGIALLAYLPALERERALELLELDAPADSTVATQLEAYGDDLHRKIDSVNRDGYLFGPHLARPGVSGIAAPILSRTAVPYMSVSISAIESRMPPGRVHELRDALLATTARMTDAIL